MNVHGIGQPKRELEPGELAYWVSKDFFEETLLLADRLHKQVKTSFTFDDGNASDLVFGAEGLARHGMKAKIFVLSARIGQPGSLGPKEIVELHKMGHEIGTHGADHLDWTSLDANGRTREFETARTEIGKIIGQPVESAAIPFGRYNRKVLRSLKAAGYKRVYSSDGGACNTGQSGQSVQSPIPRNSLTSAMTVADIEAILLGREPLKRSLRRRFAIAKKRWF